MTLTDCYALRKTPLSIPLAVHRWITHPEMDRLLMSHTHILYASKTQGKIG